MNAWADSFNGYIDRLYTDPKDVIFLISDESGVSETGKCNSIYYIVPRTNDNFSEFYSLLLTAAVSKKEVSIQVGSCSGSSRNIATHGSVDFK
mgnify:CR=1 FL=1